MDGHHLRVHAQRYAGVVSAAIALEGNEDALRLLLLLLRLSLLLLQLLFQLGDCSTVQRTAHDAAMLERSTVEARAIVVVALADDFTAAHDDAAMAIVQRGLGGLLEAKREVVVGLHVCCWCGCVGLGLGSCD